MNPKYLFTILLSTHLFVFESSSSWVTAASGTTTDPRRVSSIDTLPRPNVYFGTRTKEANPIMVSI